MKVYDHRGRAWKYQEIARLLVERGYSDRPFTDGLLTHTIEEVSGSGDLTRTTRQYKIDMLKKNILEPAPKSHPLTFEKAVLVKTSRGHFERKYFVSNGWSEYLLGRGANAVSQETLNPKYGKVSSPKATVGNISHTSPPLSPNHPQKINDEGKKVRESQNNMCGTRTLRDSQLDEARGEAYLGFLKSQVKGEEKKKEEEDSVTHTYINNGVIGVTPVTLKKKGESESVLGEGIQKTPNRDVTPVTSEVDKNVTPVTLDKKAVTPVTHQDWNGAVFVVEWDIPSNPARLRMRFYRRLKKLRKSYDYEMSTQSVLITDDKDFANDVFKLARSYGESHIYEAHQLA